MSEMLERLRAIAARFDAAHDIEGAPPIVEETTRYYRIPAYEDGHYMWQGGTLYWDGEEGWAVTLDDGRVFTGPTPEEVLEKFYGNADCWKSQVSRLVRVSLKDGTAAIMGRDLSEEQAGTLVFQEDRKLDEETWLLLPADGRVLVYHSVPDGYSWEEAEEPVI